MAKHQAAPETKTDVSPAANSNFRGRILYKSGAVQDLLVVAASTNVFTVMKAEYTKYLAGGALKYGQVGAPNWTITIYWPDVSSLYTYVD